VMIYCEGEEAEVVPVMLAKLGWDGKPMVTRSNLTPLYYVCSRCGEKLPERMARR
jgi:hypothetical protein